MWDHRGAGAALFGLPGMWSAMSPKPDLYSRVDYRRMIAWPARIEREWPLLEEVLTGGPSRRLLELGSGTGEHARFLAARGFQVVGVDASESMIARAMEEPLPENLRFILGDLADLGELVEGPFGGALCLGNTLPHVKDRERLLRAFRTLRAHLTPGAPFLFQILNYEKIFATGQRHLPLSFRPGDGGGTDHRTPDDRSTVVFLRLMEPRDDGTVLFNPTTLAWRPGQDPPLEIVSARNVLLQGWTRQQMEELLDQAGFPHRQLYGGMQKEPYQPLESPDLVVVAR